MTVRCSAGNNQTHKTLSEIPAIVYRVQDKDGRGPWKPGFSDRWVEDRDDHDNLPPFMYEFVNALDHAIIGMVFGCGCRTLVQLQRWFTPTEYATLKELGYECVKMEVGRILAESDIQCVFERNKPLRDDVEIVELYKFSASLT